MTVTDELAIYDIPFTEMESRVISWMSEALELRHGAGEDPEGPLGIYRDTDAPRDVMALLLRARQRSDRVDGLLARATQAKARARRAKEQAEFDASLAYDTAAKNGPRVDFSSARERHSEAQLASIEERRRAHQANRLVSITTEVHEVITQVHWQLDAIRKELRAVLHALQFESGMER